MTLKTKLRTIIFGTDTPAGKWFDIFLIFAILASIANGMLESIEPVWQQYGTLLTSFEWGVTFLFTVEYIARVYSAKSRVKYIKSFFGIIDILAILPSYISIFFPATHFLSVIRVLRVLRVFRILKLASYLKEYNFIVNSLRHSLRKIIVFLMCILTLVVILGSIMYLIEPPSSGFTSIPKSIYWSIVTLTTVGYGDIYPHTVLGQFIASIVMILGYGIIAVPAGLVTSEMMMQNKKPNPKSGTCQACGQKLRDA